MEHSHKAILVVSFGTSYEDARKATIERIENDIIAAFPEVPDLSLDKPHVILSTEKNGIRSSSPCSLKLWSR